MRSRQTTNLLLFLAFLFIFAVILLCLVPSKPSGQPGTERRIHGSRYPHRTTLKPRTTTTTNSATSTLPTTTTKTTSTSSYRPITTKEIATSSFITKETSTSTSSSTKYTTRKSTNIDSIATKSTTLSTTTSSTTMTTTTPSTTIATTPFTTIKYITNNSSTVESTTNPSTTMSISPNTTNNSTSVGTTYSPMATDSTTKLTLLTTSTTSSPSTTVPTITSSTAATTATPTTTTTTTSTPSTTTIASAITATTTITSSTTATTTTPSTTIDTSTLSTTSNTTIVPTEPTTTMHIMFPSPKLSNVCNSAECKDLSSKMLDSINHATTPCLDFYEYSCGGIAQDDFLVAEDPNLVLKSLLKNQMVGIHESSVKTLYETCISTPSQDEANFTNLFSSHLKITRENSDFTLIISELLKLNIAILFDVTVGLGGDDSRGHSFVPVIIPYSLNVLVPRCVDRDEILEEERILMGCAEATSHSERSSRQCRATTGHHSRLKTIREAAKRFLLFDDTFTSSEQEAMFKDVIDFLDEISLSGCTPRPSHETKITLQDLRELTNVINWDQLFEDLSDGPLLETQNIYIRNMHQFQTTFEVFAAWNSTALHNVFSLLAAEHAYRKEQADCRTMDHCLEMTIKLLPENVKSLLFDNNNSTNELASFISVISEQLGKSDAVTTNASLELIEVEPWVPSNEISSKSGHVSNIYFLRKKQRREMYRMIHLQTNEITHKNCKFLVRHRQQGCYLVFGKISVPLLDLIPPNFYMSEKIPKYLRLSGIAQSITKILYEFYTERDMNYEDDQSFYPMEIKNLNQIKVVESILQVAWDSIELHNKISRREPPEYVEQSLIWLGKEALKPLNAFLIRRAQALCRYSHDFDCTDGVKFEDFPNDWINSIMKTKLFARAFGCRLPDIDTTIRAFTEN